MGIRYYFECDKCGDLSDPRHTAYNAKRVACRAGWTCSAAWDICKHCRKRVR